MRSPIAAFLAAAVACLMLPETVAAQSFLEKLFGLSSPAPQARSPLVQELPPSSYRNIRALSRSYPPDEGWRGDNADDRPAKPGNLRAVCVRLCDGYYWPLNDHASNQSLRREADRCEASCGAEARLFYQEQDENDPSAMVDLAGQSYGSLKTAFLYRTKLIGGCGCRPAPWSIAEQNRHRGYAIADALAAQARAVRLAEAGGGVPLPSRRPSVTDLTVANLEPDVAAAATPDEMTAAAGADASSWHGEATPALQDGSDVAILAQRIEQVGRAGASRNARTASSRVTPRFTDTGRGGKTMITRSKPQKVASNQRASFLGLGKPKYVWPGDR